MTMRLRLAGAAGASAVLCLVVWMPHFWRLVLLLWIGSGLIVAVVVVVEITRPRPPA